MLQTLRWFHKWVGLLIGLQFALWAASGATMALINHHDVMGDHTRRAAAPLLLPTDTPFLPLADVRSHLAGSAVVALRLRPLLDDFVYEVHTAKGVHLLSARDGSRVSVTEDVARRVATADYAGAAPVAGVEWLAGPNLETRKHEGAIWRVAFADADNTTLYISAETGRLLERRNDAWRLWDIAWMLHIMDYGERESFNHPLIILAAVATAWLAVTGLFLVYDSFGRQDFQPSRVTRRLRRQGVPVSLRTASGTVRALTLPEGASYFDALAGAGITLPSNCGGGGSCGLCQVTLAGAPVGDADRQHIPLRALEQGCRLACRHKVVPGSTVTVPDQALDGEGFRAEVAGTRFLSPTIKEVRLRMKAGTMPTYRAGQFIQLAIPAYSTGPDRFGVPECWRADWRQLAVPEAISHQGGLRRSYSMATHPGELLNEIVLNVRFMPSPDPAAIPCGAGSSYVFGLQPGDEVRFFGPYGNFAAREGSREIVAIGGGAGMAPLRAIIRDELLRKDCKGRITYWYGARSVKDILYREEFERLQQEHTGFTWNVVLSEPTPGDDWHGHRGMVHEAVRAQYLARHRDLRSCDFLVCGPPAMLKATLEVLHRLGIPRDRIAFDDFGC